MSIWYDENWNRFYGVFHAHHFIGLITSEDGINWEKAKEYYLKNKEILKNDGTVILPDRMERPFIYVEDGLPQVLSLAIKKGDESYTIFLSINYP